MKNVLLLLWGLVASGQAVAQQPEPATPLDQVKALHLPAALDRPVAVYYVPGSETRALALRDLILDVKHFYQAQLQLDVPFSLAVLDSARWMGIESADRAPYGLPWVSQRPRIAFLPATGGLVAGQMATLTAGQAAAGRQKPPASAQPPAAPTTFRYGGAELGVLDLISLHELGHAYTDAYGINVRVPWLRELVATYFCYAYLRQQLPPQATSWEAMNRLFYQGGRPTYTALADFNRLYNRVGPDNYSWYQAFFQQRVEQVYRQQGLDFLRALPQAFPLREPPVTDGEEALARVERICPGFRAWAAAPLSAAAKKTAKNQSP